MSDFIRIDNNSAYFIREYREKNEVTGEYEERVDIKKLDSLRRYLQHRVELEPGTLFDAVWAYIEADADFFNDAFASAMGNYPLSAYIERVKNSPYGDPDRETADPDNSMQYLEAYWTTDYDDSPEDGGSIHISPAFHGCGRHRYVDIDGKEVVGECGWSVGLTPINKYFGYELRINPSVEFSDIYTDDYARRCKEARRNKKKGEPSETVLPKTLLKGERYFTVYDLLNAILYEMTWYGSPEEQEATKADLCQKIKGVEEGTIETYPIEDLFNEEE